MNRNHTALQEEGLFEVVETRNYHKEYDLLSNGANKNAFNKVEFVPCKKYSVLEGRTALYIATEKGNVDLVRLLVNAGANPLIRNKISHSILNGSSLYLMFMIALL